jgi:putative two-component system response regulator
VSPPGPLSWRRRAWRCSIGVAAPLHDIGKIAIPDSLLLKAGRFTTSEHAVMQRHTSIGADMLAGTSSGLLALARDIALTHHERWDGSGYPGGLAGDDIPIAGRIVALADVFDALTHARPYKPAWRVQDAVAEIKRAGGAQFDPVLVDAFAELDHERLV